VSYTHRWKGTSLSDEWRLWIPGFRSPFLQLSLPQIPRDYRMIVASLRNSVPDSDLTALQGAVHSTLTQGPIDVGEIEETRLRN